jgi:ATP-dependent DNA helicase RecG
VNAFRRIGLGEQAGTGIGAIYSNWRLLKRVPPMIENDKARHSFCLTLLAEELISQEQLLFQAKLGVHLSEDEASLFAQVCREGAIWPLEAKAITGRSGAETDGLLQHLMVQQLIEQRKGQTQTQYVLAPHLRDVLKPKPEDSTIVVPETSLVTGKVGGHPKSLVTDQGKALTTLSETQRLIVQFCDSPRPISFIMKHIGVTNRTFFRRSHLEPLVRGGVLKSTFPEVHQHPKQAYVLTEAGFDLKKKLDAEETTQKG